MNCRPAASEGFGPEGSHIGREESIPDTARVLGRMFDGIEFPGLPTWAAGRPRGWTIATDGGQWQHTGAGPAGPARSGVAWEGAKQIMSADQGHGGRVLEDPLTNKGTAFFEEEQPGQRSDFGEGLPRRGLPAPPPHSQGTQEKGTEEHDVPMISKYSRPLTTTPTMPSTIATITRRRKKASI